MIRSYCVGGLILAATIGGCVSVRITSTPIEGGHVAGGGGIAATLPGEWCYGRRWIGLLPVGQSACPQPKASPKGEDGPNGWHVAKLFDLGDCRREPSGEGPRHRRGLHDKKPKSSRPTTADLCGWAAGLDRYCLYSRAEAVDLEAPTLEPPLAELEPDFCGLVPTATSLVDHNGPVLHRLALDSVAAPAAGAEQARVRLAILDTLPTGPEAAQDAVELGKLCSRHGDTLFRLAEELACRDRPGCKVDATSRVALSTTPIGDPQDDCLGGTVGFIGDVGVAVVNELLAWAKTGDEERLVLNLSLGWNGQLFGGFEARESMAPTVRAVYEAFELARRAGALSFAAAGNATPGPHAGFGPLMPAAWETRESPPLIYAVSGLAADGTPLPNSRPGALARRATFGGPAAVPYGPGAGYSPPLAGSSVATAVASAAAAAHWARNPADTSAEVVRAIEDRAGQTKWRSDSSFDQSQGYGSPIRPAKACRPTLSPWGPAPEKISCSKGKGPAPTLDSIANQPFSYPQPGSNPCPPCTVDPPSSSHAGLTLWIELDPDWDWETLCVKLEAVELGTASGATETFMLSNPPCWVGPTKTQSYCENDGTLIGSPHPQTLDLTGVDMVGIEKALLHWQVVDRCGGTKGSALSSPFVGF